MTKQKHNISGIYFRSKLESGKYDSVVFEDLSDSEQDKVLEDNDEEFLKRLCKILANALYDLAEFTETSRE